MITDGQLRVVPGAKVERSPAAPQGAAGGKGDNGGRHRARSAGQMRGWPPARTYPDESSRRSSNVR